LEPSSAKAQQVGGHRALTLPPATYAPAAGRSRTAEHVLLLSGAVLVLAVSMVLPPDPRGYGTHERLFLPPCMFHKLTGLPCPGCGLTTSVCLMSRGRVSEAFLANLIGPFMWLLFVAQIPYRLYLLLRPATVVRWPRWFLKWLNLGAAVVLVISWVFNIVLHGPWAQ